MLKLQLGIRVATPLNGFLCIDFAAQPGEAGRVLGDPNKLDNLVDANECEIINCGDSLDYLPIQARQQILTHWLTRVAHGGTVILTGICPYEISRLIHLGQVDVVQANHILYGIGRKSFARPQDNVDIAMATQQFTLESIKYNPNIPYEYVVILRRK